MISYNNVARIQKHLREFWQKLCHAPVSRTECDTVRDQTIFKRSVYQVGGWLTCWFSQEVQHGQTVDKDFALLDS